MDTQSRVALVLKEDQDKLRELVTVQKDSIGFKEICEQFASCQEVLLRVIEYTEPAEAVQRVCDHPAPIINQQKEIMDRKA
jgi:hypothetical protein